MKALDTYEEDVRPGNDREDMFDFVGTVESLISAVRLNIKIVFITAFIVVAMAGLYHYVWPPVYTVEAAISVERTDDPQRDAFYKEWNLFRKEDARTEIELMKAGDVLKAVIEKESLTYDDVYHPFMSQISYFWQESIPGRAYKGFKDWIFGVDPNAPSEAEKDLGRTIKDLKAGLAVQVAGDVLVGVVRAKGPSPRIADITNTWLDEYMAWRTNKHLQEAEGSLQALTQQIEKAHREIQEISEERVQFLTENGLVFDFSKETQQVDELVKLETQLANTNTRIEIVQAKLNETEAQLAKEPLTEIVSSVTDLNQLRETAKMRRLELEAALIREQYRFRDDSPEVARIKGQIEDLTNLIESSPETRKESVTSALNPVRAELLLNQSTLKNELAGLYAAAAAMGDTREAMLEQLSAAPALAAALRDLDRRYAVAQQVYKLLLTKSAQADVALLATAYAMPSLRVVDYARMPSYKTWPKAKYLYPGALVLGLFLGAIAAWLMSSFGGRVSRLHFYNQRFKTPLFAVLDVKVDDMPSLEQYSERRALEYVPANRRA